MTLPENAAAAGVGTGGRRNDNGEDVTHDSSRDSAYEAAFAGSLLLATDSIRAEALAVAGADEVADPWCRTVVAAVAAVVEAGRAVDTLTVADWLETRGDLAGPHRSHVRSDLWNLTAACPMPMHAVEYGHIVARNAARRRLGLIGRRLTEIAPVVDETLLQHLVAAASYLPEVAR